MYYCENCNFLCDITRGQKKAEAAGGAKRKNSVDETKDEVNAAVSSSDDDEEEAPKTRKIRKSGIDSEDDDSDEEEEETSDDESTSKTRKKMNANYAEIIRLITSNEAYDEIELSNYNERELLKHPDFQKLSSKQRDLVLGAVQHMLPESDKRVKSSSIDTSGKLYYECHNCGTRAPVPAGTQIYRQSVVEQSETVADLDQYRGMADDPTLPRTRNYICPNNKCISHKDPKEAEMVTIRPSTKSYRNISVCCACNYAWQ
jgi:uncharacterized protein YeaC (DUF1315 family)